MIDFPRALLRGRYAVAAARMERNGVPIDAALYRRVVRHWDRIVLALIAAVDAEYGVYDGATFRHDRFAEFLALHEIPWPRTGTGRLKLDDETFRDRARSYPILAQLRELRRTLSDMREASIPIGADGRARCAILPFASVTGRNQPRGRESVFLRPKWIRGFIKPTEDWGVAYSDWAAQEIAIAAGVSSDPIMAEHYRSGDPYLAFGKQVGLAPPQATAETHGAVRDRCKRALIAVNYGMGVDALANSAGITQAEASELLRLHRATYRRFHRWIDETVCRAALTSEMTTVFGWARHIEGEFNPRSVINFPMQANGAEMMRIAAIAATEAGIEVCAPVHDAFLIAAPLDKLDEDVAHMRDLMTKAGRVVTGGLDVRTDVKIVRWPDRYMTSGGEQMWNLVMRQLEEVEGAL